MQRQGRDFFSSVYPATLPAVTSAVERPARPAWLNVFWFGVPAAIAATVALALALTLNPSRRPEHPPDDYIGTKGEPLVLTSFVGEPGGAIAVADGSKVPANAALRFKVASSHPCRLWIISRDQLGQVSRLFPADGDSGAEITGTIVLPGGAQLDGQPGPERIFAVCSTTPMSFASLDRLAQADRRGAEAVRVDTLLSGLPEGTTQTTLLLEKQP
jgi:hypothetical protein